MTKYTYAERVVKKVRKLLGRNGLTKDFIMNHPSIDLDEDFCLESLVWTYYDIQIIVTSNHIIYRNRLQDVAMIEYNSFDDLLKMS